VERFAGARRRSRRRVARRQSAPYRGVVAIRSLRALVVTLVAATWLGACTDRPDDATRARADRPTGSASTTVRSLPVQPTPTPSTPSGSPTAAEPPAAGTPAAPVVSDGRPRRATLSIPALGLRDLPVVPYRGWTDDAPGSAIQDRGVAASPHGPRGGVGPGGVGNYLITAHRTSSTAAFGDLPSLRPGHRVVVRAGGVRHIYEIRRTRQTSFRSQRSLAEQHAAVPGRPGATPTKAFVTLSTCATPEDHAVGNFWSDRFHNPEHRIDKIGVLVRTVAAAG
jgi:sortase A